MSELARKSIATIQDLKGLLFRFEASVPTGIAYIEKLSGDVTLHGPLENTQSGKMLAAYLETLVKFAQLTEGIKGNFPPAFFRTELGTLISVGYLMLYGNKLIKHTRAAELLGTNVRGINRLLYEYPPKLTAYHDPKQTVPTQGARVLETEVRTLMETWKPPINPKHTLEAIMKRKYR